ncbi:MAG: hypothetical protein ACTSUT_14100 [Promethearchaeota archaeon]
MGEKTVFILGAGYSKPAGLPLQRELLKGILNLSINNHKFDIAKDDLKKFISRYFKNVNPLNLEMENLFTIFDRAILNKENFINYRWKDLDNIKQEFIYAIITIIDYHMKNSLKNIPKFYIDFAKYVIEKRLSQKRGEDLISIISLNWDTLFEFVIDKEVQQGHYNKKISIDYCTYTDWLDKKINPDITLKARGIKNIKVLKPHGSINGLYCPNCGRLFIDRKENIGIQDEVLCPYCSNENSKITLETMIITPTMLKELNNLHLKYIWQNAFIEFQEAKRIVFIGYSFPIADYELRYLFKRAIQNDAKIIVVLKHSGKKVAERYKNFFGEDVKIYNRGIEKWVEESISSFL